MNEITITKTLKDKKLNSLIRFLCDMSTEICFTTAHNYHLDENVSIDIMDEYKKRCKEKHRDFEKLYRDGEPIIKELFKKARLKTKEDFENYIDEIYQNEMQVCKKMDEMIEKYLIDETTRDYNEVFPEYKDSYKALEVHMFDSVAPSLIPLDCVVYNATSEIKSLLLSMRTIFVPVLSSKDRTIMYINPLFCKNDDAFGVINTSIGAISFVVNDEDYERFKKLKIKHRRDVSADE